MWGPGILVVAVAVTIAPERGQEPVGDVLRTLGGGAHPRESEMIGLADTAYGALLQWMEEATSG